MYEPGQVLLSICIIFVHFMMVFLYFRMPIMWKKNGMFISSLNLSMHTICHK